MPRISPPRRRHRTGDMFSGSRRILLLPIAGLQMALAWMAAVQPGLIFVAVIGGAALIAALILPATVLLMALPATFAYWRVGPAAIDMSVTDAVLILATIGSIPFVPWRSRQLRIVLGALAIYVGVLLVAVAASPSQAAAFDVFHRALMVAGSAFVGSAIATRGHTRLALRIFLLTASVVAVLAILATLRSGFAPAYPLGMHKNAIGAIFASALIVMMTVSKPVGFPRLITIGMASLIGAGLLASQSRAAMLALFFVVAVHMVAVARRTGAAGVFRFAPVMLAAAIVLLGFAVFSFNEQRSGTDSADAVYGSVGSRTTSYEYAIEHVWKPHVLFGSGPKFFDSGQAGGIIPHNIVVLELAESGLAGFAGLAVLLTACQVVMFQSRTRLGDAAFLTLLERIIEAMLSLFWVAGSGTVPFLILGLMIGEDAQLGRDGEDEVVPESSPSQLGRPESVVLNR